MNEIETRFTEELKQINANYTLSSRQLEQLRIYYENLIEWNQVMNLTTITEEQDVYVKHFLDSLSILRAFQPEDFSGRKLIDVGTGAGFPGLVLAIAFPDLQIVLMDSLNKRINFLNDTIAKLELRNVTTIHARAEELARNKTCREKFDFTISRAVANLTTLSEYDLPFVRTGGYMVAYKSEKAEEEVQNAAKAVSILGGQICSAEKFILPGTDYERCLVVIRKVKTTPGKYPRKAGTPAREPLG